MQRGVLAFGGIRVIALCRYDGCAQVGAVTVEAEDFETSLCFLHAEVLDREADVSGGYLRARCARCRIENAVGCDHDLWGWRRKTDPS